MTQLKSFIATSRHKDPQSAHSFGKPDKTFKNPRPKDFYGKQGIIVFNVNWSNATGHTTLWNGAICSDHCYFPVALEASIWHLK